MVTHRARICVGCREVFVPTRLNQAFHSKECRLQFHAIGGQREIPPSTEYEKAVRKHKDSCKKCGMAREHYVFFDSIGAQIRPRKAVHMLCDNCAPRVADLIYDLNQLAAKTHREDKLKEIAILQRHIPILEANGHTKAADWNRARIKELEEEDVVEERPTEESNEEDAPPMSVGDLVF